VRVLPQVEGLKCGYQALLLIGAGTLYGVASQYDLALLAMNPKIDTIRPIVQSSIHVGRCSPKSLMTARRMLCNLRAAHHEGLTRNSGVRSVWHQSFNFGPQRRRDRPELACVAFSMHDRWFVVTVGGTSPLAPFLAVVGFVWLPSVQQDRPSEGI
jgi:hypothetical protein